MPIIIYTPGQKSGPEGPLATTAPVIFEFTAAVDLPPAADGGIGESVEILQFTHGGLVPAPGDFAIADHPALPPGNRRRLVFQPSLPQQQGIPAGLPEAQAFVVEVRALPDGILVGGKPLRSGVTAHFNTCDSAKFPGSFPAWGSPCFGDPVEGPPFVVDTVPASFDPPPPGVDPGLLKGARVTMLFSEALAPATVSTNSVRLLNLSTGLQVAGSVEFFQRGTPEAGPDFARVDYIPSSPLLGGTAYEILVDGDVRDFANNPALPYDPSNPGTPPGGRRLFATSAVALCPAPLVVEDFATTANLASTSGLAVWEGTGTASIAFPLDITGDGSFGPLAFPVGPSSLDTGQPPVQGFAEGTLDASSVLLPAGASVRVFGPYRLHIRCTGSIEIDGTIDAGAGTNPAVVAAGTPEQGPRPGATNNPAAAPIVRGGVGGPGGGDGGRASHSGLLRTPAGEPGFGPTFGGLPNPGPFGANSLYAGGPGGTGGFRFPAGGVMGELGGLGGAGGTGFLPGGDGLPEFSPSLGCAPFIPAPQPVAAASPVPSAMIAPVSVASAGSGGGGGGDRFEISGPTADDQGGGAGGGGGGVRFSATGPVVLGSNAVIRASGAGGAPGSNFFGGSGGGGSGGQVWIQSLDHVSVPSTAEIRVTGGPGAKPCTDHASGAGGVGLIQLEDVDGVVNTGFNPPGGGANGKNVVAVPIFPAGLITGSVQSTFHDTGYGAPEFDPVRFAVAVDFGSNPVPGGAVAVEFQGAHESSQGGSPDLSTLSAWIAGTSIDGLNGYRYVRWRVLLSYDAPNLAGTGATTGHTLPAINSLSFGYGTPCNP